MNDSKEDKRSAPRLREYPPCFMRETRKRGAYAFQQKVVKNDGLFKRN